MDVKGIEVLWIHLLACFQQSIGDCKAYQMGAVSLSHEPKVALVPASWHDAQIQQRGVGFEPNLHLSAAELELLTNFHVSLKRVTSALIVNGFSADCQYMIRLGCHYSKGATC
jgi:hypothetical protein